MRALSIFSVISLMYFSSAQAALNSQDQAWAMKSTQGNLFEIQLGEFALKKFSGKAKLFGEKMVRDHGKSLGELRIVAREQGLSLPNAPGDGEKIVIDFFGSSGSADLAYDYLAYEVSDHKADIADTVKEIRSGSNPALVGQAQKDLPILREHLRLAEQYSKEVEH